MAASTASWPPSPNTDPSAKPRFISSFTNSLPFFYFHHIIDAENALLTVEVIGPNLTFTFSHEKAKDFRTPSKISARLECKTTGFLALVRGEDRHVLAIAESGHGHGQQGDLLDAPLDSPILPNRVWAHRVARIGELLGIRMSSPMDLGRADGDAVVGYAADGTPILVRDERRGKFQGGHVEVKLAVYAVCTMLKEFGITTDFDNLTTAHLRKLKRVRWEDGTRPGFEVYFSRKNCSRCGLLAKRLEKLTGMKIQFLWKDRMVKMAYKKRLPNDGPPTDGTRRVTVRGIIEINEDDDDDDDFAEESSLSSDNTVDLTSHDATGRSEIDLTSATDDIRAQVDLTETPLGDQPGQLETLQSLAEVANMNPAPRPRPQREAAVQVEDKDINKPVPATPVFEDPRDDVDLRETMVPQRRYVVSPGDVVQRHVRSLPAPPVTRCSKVLRKRRLSLTEGLDPAMQHRMKRPAIPLVNPPRKQPPPESAMEAAIEGSSGDKVMRNMKPSLERERRPYPSIEAGNDNGPGAALSLAEHPYTSIEADVSDSSSDASIPSTLPVAHKSHLGLSLRNSSACSPKDPHCLFSHHAADDEMLIAPVRVVTQQVTPPKTPWGMPGASCMEASNTQAGFNRDFSLSPSPF